MIKKRGGLDASVSIYEGATSPAEVKRLSEAAAVADKVSLDHLTGAGTVADIGAGNSPTLGKILVAGGKHYVAIDQRPDAVADLRDAGLSAQVGTVYDTKLQSKSVDAVHARFLFGWLPVSARNAALSELCRILPESGSMTIIDYDWGVTQGPSEMMALVNTGVELLRRQGFDPLWGSQLPDWMHGALSEAAPGANITITQTNRTSLYSGPIKSVLNGGFIDQTKNSLMATLERFGEQQLVADIEQQYQQLYDYAQSHPDELVRLPDIVGMTVRLDNNPPRPERQSASSLQPDKDYEIVFSDDGRRVVVANSPDMVTEIRRTQAESYIIYGLVGKDAVDADGVLREEIEPPDQVARSVYGAVLDEHGDIRAVMRFIEQDNRGDGSLPEIARLNAETYQQLQQWLQSKNVDSRQIIEVSGLAKSVRGGDVYDIEQVLVGLAQVARVRGYQAAIMGLRQEEVPLIQAMFGKEVIQCVGGAHDIHLPHVDGNIAYQTAVVDLRSLFDDSLRYHEQAGRTAFAAGLARAAKLAMRYGASDADRGAND